MNDNNRVDIEIVNADHSISIRETLTITFYMRKPHLDMLDAVATTIRDFASLVSFASLNNFFDYDGEQQYLDKDSLDNIITERFFSIERHQNANIILSGSGIHAPSFYLWYSGTAIDNPELPAEASFLWCWMPRQFFLMKQPEVMAFIAAAASRIPFSSGYVSFGLAGEDMSRMQALAWRYPGLDIARPLCISSDIFDKAAGIYWLNFLGPFMTIALSGVYGIRSKVPSDVICLELNEGKCCVQLGTEPQLGDVNSGESLPNYRAFAKLLYEAGLLHVPEQAVYFLDSDSVADRDAMQRWHLRFVT